MTRQRPAPRPITAAAVIAALTFGAATAAEARDLRSEIGSSALREAVFVAPAQAPAAVPRARPALAELFDKTNALRAAGVARTAVDRSFGRDEVVGALGFLCGRPDNLNSDGAAGAYGADPHGRFLGAKLSVAF